MKGQYPWDLSAGCTGVCLLLVYVSICPCVWGCAVRQEGLGKVWSTHIAQLQQWSHCCASAVCSGTCCLLAWALLGRDSCAAGGQGLGIHSRNTSWVWNKAEVLSEFQIAQQIFTNIYLCWLIQNSVWKRHCSLFSSSQHWGYFECL